MYRTPIDVLLKKFNSSENGLTQKQVEKNRITYGVNELTQKEGTPALTIFLNQFKNFIVWILIAAVVISSIIAYTSPHGDSESFVDAIVISIILVLNALLGFIQEFKAEKSIQALKKLTALKATVRRDRKIMKIDAIDLVPGDILVLDTGDKVGADCRILDAVQLQAQEAALTGESSPVSKNTEMINRTVALGDQKNMVFSSTVITRGRATALVVATGMHTQIGTIAHLMNSQVTQKTPLQIQLAKLGKHIGILTLVICGIVLAAGFLKGGAFKEMFIVAISLAVAAVPEGLPAVVTISLALGIQRMIKRNGLIRNLPSVETLGSTSIICTDKTGTLTHNQMTVVKVFANNEVINVTGRGYSSVGTFSSPPKNFSRMLEIGALCNDASLSKNTVIGDPTEGCLLVSALKGGINYTALQKKYPRVSELPFDSARKLMTTVHTIQNSTYAYVKGAPDQILSRCNRIEKNGKVSKLNEHERIAILHQNDQFAKNALRVLGFAYKQSKGTPTEENLIFVGLQAMIDPPREEVKESIATCHAAGIRVAMITGDYITTANAIASELGIRGKAVSGEQIDAMKSLEKEVDSIAIYARVNPEHKLRIVEALQKNGHVVAMTGDGVNDAPALKKADIGVAMGITGTDVAKEASQMILTDDNFASIVNAVEEGRGIYANIKKFVYYLLSSNVGEVLTIFIAIIIGFQFNGVLVIPLLATQLLWMNLVTDGLPALALGVTPVERNAMKFPPRNKDERILDRWALINIVSLGSVMMVGTLYVFNRYLNTTTAEYAQTMAFTTLVMFQLFNVLNFTGMGNSVISAETFRNKWLWLAIGCSVLLQLFVVYVPFLNAVFHTSPLLALDWLIIVGISTSVIVASEILKSIHREYHA